MCHFFSLCTTLKGSGLFLVKLEPMRILITGENGYLGHSLLQHAPAAYALRFLPARLEHLSPDTLTADLVIHTAGALRHREDCWQSNVEGTQRLLSALKGQPPLIFCSSRGVTTDDDYGRSKATAEELLQKWPALILRLPTCVGWNGTQAGRSFVTEAAQKWLRNETVTLWDNMLREDLYVNDVARWLWELTFHIQENRDLWTVPFQARTYALGAPSRNVQTLFQPLIAALEQTGYRPQVTHKSQEKPARFASADTPRFHKDFTLSAPTPDEVWCRELIYHLKAHSC